MTESIREVTTIATLEEKKKLRKEFRFFGMIFYTFTAIVGINSLGTVSSNGGQALPWLLISAVTFFLPYGLLTAELGSTFTQEGGVYEWCKLAGGRFYGALATMLYWVANPLWVGGSLSLTAIVAIKTFWFGSANFQFGGNNLTDAIVEILIALVFVWGTTWSAILSLRFGQRLSTFGGYIKLALFFIFVVLATAFLFVGGHSKEAHLSFRDVLPTSDWRLIVSGILPVLIFSWGGFELENGAGEEMRNPRRDVPRALVRAGIIAVIAYAIPIIAILIALPKDQLSNISGFLNAFAVVNGILSGPIATGLGWLVALGIAIALASTGATWLMGADRIYAISTLDRTGPALLGRFSERYGTPIVVNTTSGIIATVALIVVILINAFGSGSISTLFGLVFGFAILTTTLSYLLIFPTFLILRYKYPNLHRPYKVPGGMVGAWIVTLLTWVYAAIATYFILIPTDASIASTNVSRLTYELTQFIPLVIIFLLTVVLYIWGQKESRTRDVVVELKLDREGELSAEVLE